MGPLLLLPFLALLIFCCSSVASAQSRYYDVWHFGDSTGLNFRSGAPSIVKGSMNTLEGCSSICNPGNGNLLFYTDGVFVWNRRHQLMRGGTGLFGHPSATQAALIVPLPDDPLLYYVFTLDGLTAGGGVPVRGLGLNYSIVNMSGDNGMGEVVQKNTPLLTSASEKLAGIRRENGCGVWIVTHQMETGRFYAWLLSAAGLLAKPVISEIGSKYENWDAGYLEASPDGTMLFAVRAPTGVGELFRFNSLTGQVEEKLAELGASYGASFSPDNKLLYAGYQAGGKLLVQYDLRNGTDRIDTNIIASISGSEAFQGMQLGPDGRIYVNRGNHDSSHLAVIERPNFAGVECGYQHNPDGMPPQQFAYYGLPNCIDGFLGESNAAAFSADIDLVVSNDTMICSGDSIGLHVSGATTYVWYPSEGLSCVDCPDPIASPDTTTTYVVTAFDPIACAGLDSVTIAVPRLVVSGDTAICSGDDIRLHASGSHTYKWRPSVGLSCANCPDPLASPDVTTTYVVTSLNEVGCIASDSVTLTVVDRPIADAGGDTAICIGEVIRLRAGGGHSYRWSPSDDLSCSECADPIASPDTTTTYEVVVTGEGGCTSRDEVTVSVQDAGVKITASDTAVCRGEMVALRATGGTEIHWSPSDGLSCTDCRTPTATPRTTTMYVAQSTGAGVCSNIDSITIVVYDSPIADAGNDRTICLGDSVQLLGSDAVNYFWTPAVDISCLYCPDPIVYPQKSITYYLQVTNEWGCIGWDSVTVTVETSGNVNGTGDTAFCRGGSAQLSAVGAESCRWNPATGLSCTDCTNPTATPEETTTYYVIGSNASGDCPAIDSVIVTIHDLPFVEAGVDTAVCDGTNVRLSATGATAYQWDPLPDLSCLDCADPVASPRQTTMYYVTGISPEGCEARDSVRVIVHPGLTVAAGDDRSICIGDSVQLEATGGVRWEWEPVDGLSCVDCRAPVASPVKTTTYRVTAWSEEGCEGSDEVEVVLREEPEMVQLRIGREYHGRTGEQIVIGVEFVDTVNATNIAELELELHYDPRVMRVDVESIERLLEGTALEGWGVEIAGNESGRLLLRLTAPAGTTLSGSGDLLRFEGTLYLSNVRGTELPFTISTPSRCFGFATEAGLAFIDSICGLNLRLIELTAGKYVAPAVYPNPASDRVTFEFGLGLDGPTRLEVFDALGNRVGLIVEDRLTAGQYAIDWDVHTVASGIYWYRLTSGDWNEGGEVRIHR